MKRRTHKEMVEVRRPWFADHTLRVLVETRAVTAVSMAKPGTNNLSVEIAFMPSGIHIGGDVCFGPEMGVYAPYKGLGWFASGFGESPGYLCGKFRLRCKWSADVARDQAVSWLDDLRPIAPDDDGTIDTWQVNNLHDARCAIAELDECEAWDSPERVIEKTYDIFGDYIEATVADPCAVATLCVVQETFARLWAEHCAAKVPAPEVSHG